MTLIDSYEQARELGGEFPIVGFQQGGQTGEKGWIQGIGFTSHKYIMMSADDGVGKGNSYGGTKESLEDCIARVKRWDRSQIHIFKSEKELFAWLSR